MFCELKTDQKPKHLAKFEYKAIFYSRVYFIFLFFFFFFGLSSVLCCFMTSFCQNIAINWIVYVMVISAVLVCIGVRVCERDFMHVFELAFALCVSFFCI